MTKESVEHDRQDRTSDKNMPSVVPASFLEPNRNTVNRPDASAGGPVDSGPPGNDNKRTTDSVVTNNNKNNVNASSSIVNGMMTMRRNDDQYVTGHFNGGQDGGRNTICHDHLGPVVMQPESSNMMSFEPLHPSHEDMGSDLVYDNEDDITIITNDPVSMAIVHLAFLGDDSDEDENESHNGHPMLIEDSDSECDNEKEMP